MKTDPAPRSRSAKSACSAPWIASLNAVRRNVGNGARSSGSVVAVFVDSCEMWVMPGSLEHGLGAQHGIGARRTHDWRPDPRFRSAPPQPRLRLLPCIHRRPPRTRSGVRRSRRPSPASTAASRSAWPTDDELAFEHGAHTDHDRRAVIDPDGLEPGLGLIVAAGRKEAGDRQDQHDPEHSGVRARSAPLVVRSGGSHYSLRCNSRDGRGAPGTASERAFRGSEEVSDPGSTIAAWVR